MARKRYTEEQIIGVLHEAEAGAKTSELCRKHGVSEATFYKWKAKYAGLTVSELKRLRSLEDENRRLKQIVAQRIWPSICKTWLRSRHACGTARMSWPPLQPHVAPR